MNNKYILSDLKIHFWPLTTEYPRHRPHTQPIAEHGQQEKKDQHQVFCFLVHEGSKNEEADAERANCHYGRGDENGSSSSKFLKEKEREYSAKHSQEHHKY